MPNNTSVNYLQIPDPVDALSYPEELNPMAKLRMDNGRLISGEKSSDTQRIENKSF
jgi:hypothetical protein